MNKYHIMSILCFILAFILLAFSISKGEGKVYWAVIIPIIEGTGLFSFLGVIFIFLGFIFLMIALVSGSYEWVPLEDFGWGEAEEKPRARKIPAKGTSKSKTYREERGPTEMWSQRQYPQRTTKSGGVIFIGPIPIIWGSDRRIAYIMAVVAVILAVIFLLFALAWIF
ncbi:TIGR00304 family membrane protein [[Eubacterium] cellulosolvens]